MNDNIEFVGRAIQLDGSCEKRYCDNLDKKDGEVTGFKNTIGECYKENWAGADMG